MSDQKPGVVLTDGDPTMRVGIIEFLPDTKHHLCVWNLGINATQKKKKKKKKKKKNLLSMLDSKT